MWLGFALWLVTRGVVAITALFAAGVSATVSGRVPLVLNDVLLWSLRVYGYQKKKTLPENPVVVFDHPTLFDHSVLMQQFGPLRFLTKMSNMSAWPLSAIARSFRCVPASFESLESSLQSSQSSADHIFVAPDPRFTRKFRTGAFRVSKEVLPIVTHYEPAFVHSNSIVNTMALHVSKIGCPTFYASRVMTPIARAEIADGLESVEAYAARVQTAMDDERELARMDLDASRKSDSYWTSEYSGSIVLVLSSSMCFFLPAFLGYSAPWSRLAMVAQGITSVWYHSTGRPDAFWWDMWLRNLFGPSFVILDIVAHGNWRPLIFGVFAVLHYASGVFTEIEHALLVHLPVMIGFFSYVGI